MLTIKTLLLAAAIYPFIADAQNLVKNGNAESGEGMWSNVQIAVGKCYKTLAVSSISSELIPVDNSKVYVLSGMFKSADAKKTNIYFGLVPFDTNGDQIAPESVNAVDKTETELAVACSPGDTVIKIKDGSNWKIAKKNDLIAFDVDDSGKYRDLPNNNFAGSVINAENKDGAWELTLDKPCGKTYPAGTKVRQHKSGSSYMYIVYKGQFQSNEWANLSGTVKDARNYGAGQFWPRTKAVKVVILAMGGGQIYFDDIKLEENK